MVLGLWRLQLFFELQQARIHGRLPWSANALDQLKKCDLSQFYQGVPEELTLSAETALVQAMPESRSVLEQYRLPPKPLSSDGGSSCGPKLVPRSAKDERNQAEDQVNRVDRRVIPLMCILSRNKEAYVQGFESGEEGRYLHWSCLNLSTLDYEFVNTWPHHEAIDIDEDFSIALFRPLGLTLWEEKRILELGLWHVHTIVDEPDAPDSSYYYKRWLTLIPEGIDIQRCPPRG